MKATDFHIPTLEVWQTFPKLGHYVLNLAYVPEHKRSTYEKAWGEWCRKNPRRVWPAWLRDYVELKRGSARPMTGSSTGIGSSCESSVETDSDTSCGNDVSDR